MTQFPKMAAAGAPTKEADRAGIVKAALQRSSQIATLPAVAAQIIRLAENPDSTINDLHNVIVNDPALGIRILKLVNSAYYGLPGQIDSIKRAMHLLGMNAVKNIAITASMVKLFRGGRISADFNAGDLWTHSIAVATAAQMLARQVLPGAADEAFLAGLIHDMGILVEMQASRPAFVQMIQLLAADEGLTFRAAEERVLGASHEALGAGLCRGWNFPLCLQLVTGYHHRPWDLDEADRRLPALVHVADVLAARLGLGYARTVETHTLDPQLIRFLNLTETGLETVVQKLPDAILESQTFLSAG